MKKPSEENVELTKTQRLYGADVDFTGWLEMPAYHYMLHMITLAAKRIQELYLEDIYDRNDYNITECMAAIRHWRGKLKEAGMMDMSEEELLRAINDLGDGHHKLHDIECQVEKNRHDDARKAAKQRKKNAKPKSTTT